MKNSIWNLFSEIHNGLMAKRKFVFKKKKPVFMGFLKVLVCEGYLTGYCIFKEDSDILQINLKYINGKPAIKSMKTISKPGRKIYWSTYQIHKIKCRNKLIIISTHKGLKTLIECKKENIGGEPFIIIR